MPNFDLAEFALKSVCPNNVLLYDDKNIPSIMVKIPKMTYAELGLGSSNAVHPAFIVNGVEKDAIYISKYMNIVQNGRAYSLPGQDIGKMINFDNALKACTDKGAGWHLMTAFEWGLIIAWCEYNGFIPLGNSAYGKWYTETNYKAIPMAKDGTGTITWSTAGGTGPLEWYHDKTLSGIADLCGNGWEWTGGIRTVKGELQILTNNNAADGSNPQTAASTLWKAIKGSDGALIDPDGNGTTAGSIKMDWDGSALKYDTSISDSSPGEHYCLFKDITYNSTNIGTDAVALLRALGMLPVASSLISTYSRCYFNNAQAERLYRRGGSFDSSFNSGFATFYGIDRSHMFGDHGFRSAYVDLGQ